MTKEYLFTSEPVSLMVDLHGTGEANTGAITILTLLIPMMNVYKRNYGHFDRTSGG